MITFKRVRIAALLVILTVVGVSTYLQVHHTATWKKPINITIYPINGDGSETAETYIRSLSYNSFQNINLFMESEAQAYGVPLRPLFYINLGNQLDTIPPNPPGDTRDKLAMIGWSLKLRFWLVRNVSSFGLDSRHIRIFVAYHKGIKGKPLRHSFGLQKGLIGVVHAFASERQDSQNNVVITHELLHILGAGDKYDQQGLPIYPVGYADPDKQPLLPQDYAEIMGGRIPESPSQAAIPGSLEDCLIGPTTAAEINWGKTKLQ